MSRLVAASDDPSRQYKVTILNSPVANAFALPGGYLYLTRGLVALTDESSELAAVISHEMAHVLLNHALERAKVAEQAEIVERVATDVSDRSDRQPLDARRLADDPRHLLAQPGDRGRPGRHHHRRARRLRPVRRRALPRQAASLCGIPLRRSATMTTRPASSPRIRQRPSAASSRWSRRGSSARPASASAPMTAICRRSTAWCSATTLGRVRARPRVPAPAARDRLPRARQFPAGEHQGGRPCRGRRRHRHALRRRDRRRLDRRLRPISPPAGSTGSSTARSRRRR